MKVVVELNQMWWRGFAAALNLPVGEVATRIHDFVETELNKLTAYSFEGVQVVEIDSAHWNGHGGCGDSTYWVYIQDEDGEVSVESAGRYGYNVELIRGNVDRGVRQAVRTSKRS